MTRSWPKKESEREEDLPDGRNAMCKGQGRRAEQEVIRYGKYVSLGPLRSRSQEAIRRARDFLGEHPVKNKMKEEEEAWGAFEP